eukprot:TRINITY_DN24298_c0_g1_i1.p1 TRINITY_DN24298_c0_g1~~TRINITY_DN24298_c0_g1_i1.p1  ORF type:complete len:259 (+),score=43.38 TRINITY_DN24298_c0_g1_i1:58-777(+)
MELTSLALLLVLPFLESLGLAASQNCSEETGLLQSKQNKAQRESHVSKQASKQTPASLGIRQSLKMDEQLESSNGFYRFQVQGDGNFVIYRNARNEPIWSLWGLKEAEDDGLPTGCEDGCSGDEVNFTMQGDGNVLFNTPKKFCVMYDQNFPMDQMSACKVAGRSPACEEECDATVLTMQNDGNLVLFGSRFHGEAEKFWCWSRKLWASMDRENVRCYQRGNHIIDPLVPKPADGLLEP